MRVQKKTEKSSGRLCLVVCYLARLISKSVGCWRLSSKGLSKDFHPLPRDGPHLTAMSGHKGLIPGLGSGSLWGAMMVSLLTGELKPQLCQTQLLLWLILLISSPHRCYPQDPQPPSKPTACKSTCQSWSLGNPDIIPLLLLLSCTLNLVLSVYFALNIS